MTNEQKQAIREAAENAWLIEAGTPAAISGVVAAIEKYDELLNKKFNPPEPSQDNEYIAFFIPAGEMDKKFIRVFDSLSEMFQKLSAEFKSNIAVSDSRVDKSDSNWPNPKYLYKIYLDKNKIVHIGDYIGICDYLSFKKG